MATSTNATARKRPAPKKPPAATAKKAAAAKKAPAKKAAPRKKAPAKAAPRKKAPPTRSTPTGTVDAARGASYGERGRRLWDAHADQIDGERGLVLLEEACRIADRLDGLARILGGRTELIEIRVDEGIAVFVVDAALVEARQQATVLRQLVAALPLKEIPGDGGDDDDWVDNL